MRRRFVRMRPQERDDVDLFFADLTGSAPGIDAEAMSSVHRAAEEFFAELAGESIEAVTSARAVRPAAGRRAVPLGLPPAEDFAEQPAPVAVVLPAAIPPKWTGVDRKYIPGAPAAAADPAWMGTLIDNSNLRFTGAYVTGPPPAGTTASDYTGSSKDVARGWMANIQTLADQGWGVVFFYVGYSVGGGHPAPAGLTAARGTLHGQHLRATLHALGPAWAGATVFIDNEDLRTTTLPNDLIDYYVALFAEMSRPDPTQAAFRPALYSRGNPVEQLLERRRDLFIWDVLVANGPNDTPAFDATVDPITIDPVRRLISAYKATPAGQSTFVTWSLGRQFWYYSGKMPRVGSAVANRLGTWRREKGWDYDVSFVRNPAFPVGEPRIVARMHAGSPVVVADFFEARGTGAAPPPRSRVMTQGPAQSAALGLAAGVTVEPDAPLTMFPRGGDLVVATVLNGGDIGVATRSAAGAWSTIDRMAGTMTALRRLRALRGASNTVSNAHLFYIGADDRLYVKRAVGTGAWSGAQVVNPDLRLHPFSGLASEARGNEWVETYVIDDRGLLTTAFWSRRYTTPFPGFHVQRLETAPSLLPDGALSAICPQFDHVLVFGVGLNQQLHFVYFVQGHGWSAVTAVGGAQDLVGVHTRMNAHAISATDVEVAVLTDAGQLTMYPFRLTGHTWAAGARQVVANPRALVGAAPTPPANAVLQPADGFRINPFGDVRIVREPRQANSTVFCAGLRASESKTLRWNAGSTDVWQYVV